MSASRCQRELVALSWLAVTEDLLGRTRVQAQSLRQEQYIWRSFMQTYGALLNKASVFVAGELATSVHLQLRFERVDKGLDAHGLQPTIELPTNVRLVLKISSR